MTPHDQPFPAMFSRYLARNAPATSSWYSALPMLVGVSIVLLSWWLVPLGSLLLCILGGLLILCARRTRWAREYGSVIAAAAAVPLGVDVVQYGRPALWWLHGATVVAVVAHVTRPPAISIRRVLLTNVRNAVISVAAGVASVLAIQLTLHYISEHHAVLARTWTLRIGEARAWMENIVLLAPTKLAVLLALLVATAVIVPSLNVIRNYRRVSLAASHSLLALIVATSFVFFGNSYSRAAEWKARLSMAQEHLAAINKDHREVIKAAVVERTLVRLPASQRALLIALGQEIQKHSRDPEVQRRIADQLIAPSKEALARHLESTHERVEQGQPSHEHRRSQEVLEPALQRVKRGEPVSRDELATLKIERTRAEARREEARDAIRQLFVDTVCPPFVGELIQSMLDAAQVKGRVRPVDRAAVLSAMNHVATEPPRVSFDHVIPNPTDKRGEQEWFAVTVATVVRKTEFKVQEERQARAKAAEAKRLRSRSGGSYGGGGMRSGGGTSRSRGGSRFGVRGGGPPLVA